MVAVHRVVAADDARDAEGAVGARRGAPAFDLLHEARARVRLRVAAVGEAVHEQLADLEARREFDERVQVLEARVHAAVGCEADEVHARGDGEGVADHGVRRERARGDGFVDAHEVLAHDRARAEVQVADLGVAHLAFRETHGVPAGAQGGVRVGRPETVEDGGGSERDRVARPRLREPPAVQHHEARGGKASSVRGLLAHAAAFTIAMKGSGFSEAPPTSAPSTSGSESSSAAFSGFTEPP